MKYDINFIWNTKGKNMRKKFVVIFVSFFVLITVVLSVIILKYKNAIEFFIETDEPKNVFYAEDFGFEDIKSNTDYDNDGLEDYADIVEGARIDAENKPTYRSKYYDGGYPPDNEGVCADVVWRALKNAGYLLKDMVDEDIKNNVSLYPRVEGKPDPNIDFRRVKNLKVFFERNHISLTIDLSRIEEWNPGDIVIFQSESKDHIGIISDKRNAKGIPYIIHNAGQENREEDGLEFYNEYAWPITGHYRLRDINEEENW